MCQMINTTEVCVNCGKTVGTKLKRDKCPHYGTTRCKQENLYVTKKVSASNCSKCSKDAKNSGKNTLGKIGAGHLVMELDSHLLGRGF
ncbi:hypothetical protein FPRO05_11903 [Fusarium proliferatum]|uniref:Uncharacterized protein n=1 Tax=Gibberella intermedia TaxID=948311 RepID=A0A365N5F8_GIBIN|nr:hypothetical protein FPRO05_11903 [Fusarium proliferatum]